MAILGEIKKDDLEGMSPNIPEGAKKLLNDIGPMKKKKIKELFPKDAGYSQSDARNAADLIESMIKWNPAKRVSAEKALEHKFFEGIDLS